MNKGFTLIELVVVIAIIAVLSGIILFSTTQYINRSKDSNISGNLAILILAGETYYGGNSYSYSGFCDPDQNSVIKNVVAQIQIPQGAQGSCSGLGESLTPGVCCNVAVDGNSWAACAREFANPDNAYCVDSRGMKREIGNTECTNTLTRCS